jgi:hypothetical protein
MLLWRARGWVNLSRSLCQIRSTSLVLLSHEFDGAIEIIGFFQNKSVLEKPYISMR